MEPVVNDHTTLYTSYATKTLKNGQIKQYPTHKAYTLTKKYRTHLDQTSIDEIRRKITDDGRKKSSVAQEYNISIRTLQKILS